jgi:hypothetical protein
LIKASLLQLDQGQIKNYYQHTSKSEIKSGKVNLSYFLGQD